MTMRMALAFEDEGADLLSVSGGKGASLARLAQGGFPVPPGIIIPSHAYQLFASSASWLAEDVAKLPFASAERLREACAGLRERLRGEELPSSLLEQLTVRLQPLLAKGPVAVRSSSTMEDLAGAAFAGQHDTYLHVTSVEDVIERVADCFVSLWEDRAVMYRHQRGFDHMAASMAVVVQQMVAAEVAGVAFTLNPIDGSLDEVVVNASWGLGETVVSGEGDVDQYRVRKDDRAIVERHVSEKTHEIVGVDRGTESREITGDRRTDPCLTDDELNELVSLALRVEDRHGFPQDIEWAMAGGELFLLQSRPVTSFPARWTRQESAERFPTPVTPLTWEFVKEGFHASLAHSLEIMGLPSFEGSWFDRFDGYIYGNETAVRIFTSGRQFAFSSLDELRGMLPAIRERYAWAMQLPVLWARDLDRYLIALGRLSAVDLKALSDEEAWAHLCRVNALGADYFLPNIAISITHGLLHRMLHRFVTVVAGPSDAAEIYDALTCFCETKTSLVNQELEGLAAIVRGEPQLLDLLLERPRREIWEQRDTERWPKFHARLVRFIEDHGHRETDFDAYHPTWVGQPWIVLEHVRMIASEKPVDAHSREIDLRDRQQEAERAFLARVPDDLRYFGSELIRLARAYTGLDDLEHYQTTRLSIPFREAAVEIGSRLVAKGVLEEPGHAFFLSRDALARWATTGDLDGLREEATRNRDEFDKATVTTARWSLTADADENEVPDGAMKGLPGSPGVAAGPAYLVRGPEDFGSFPRGSVLVARTTNPAWTPLFHAAIAVVTESGGPLSHGAVTAREVGIPAVMAVRNIMQTVENGMTLNVDGTAGRVTLDADPEA